MYKSQTLRDIIRQIESDIALEMDLETLPPVGEARAIAFAVGAAKRDLHDHITWLAKQIVPSTDSDDQTIIDAANYEGVPRKVAAKAQGTATIRTIDGSDNGELPLDTVFQHQSGQRYTVTQANAITDGEITFTIKAASAGTDGNLADETQELSLVSPIEGLQSTATITALSGGADLEPLSELLSRLWFRKQNPPMGGALHDYQAWATEVSEVTRAWAYDHYQGGSTVGLAFVCDNLADIIPTDAKVAEVASYIDKHQDPSTGQWVGRPGGIELVVFQLRLKSVQLTIKLTPDTSEIREHVYAQLKSLAQTDSEPGATIKLSQVRTAIGSTAGVTDYQCDLNADITSATGELITFKEPLWQTT
jgi:uncharacterized phage protein gp47/JayE